MSANRVGRSAADRVLVCLHKFARPFLAQNFDEQIGLRSIFPGLQSARIAPASIGDDQFVNGEALRPRDLHERP